MGYDGTWAWMGCKSIRKKLNRPGPADYIKTRICKVGDPSST